MCREYTIKPHDEQFPMRPAPARYNGSMRKILVPLIGVSLLLGACGRSAQPTTTAPAASGSAITRHTYRNEKYGFELTYPLTWTVDEESTNRQLKGLDYIFYGTEFSTSEGLRVDKAGRLGIRTPISHFDKKLVRSTSDMTIGGEPARLVETTEAMNPMGAGVKHVFVQHGDIILQFQTSGPLLDKGVISSLRFTR